ncbi:MAG: hypothetical protein WBW92_08505 [Rhodanobacteraceae bacterium]
MKMLFNRYALIGLVCAGLAMGAGAASAGKTTTQFAVTLTVASRCSVTTSAGVAAGQHASATRDLRSTRYPVAVDTSCRHGGQVDVKVEDPHKPGPAAVSVARSDGTSGQARFSLSSEESNSASQHSVRQAVAESSQSAPMVVTVMF